MVNLHQLRRERQTQFLSMRCGQVSLKSKLFPVATQGTPEKDDQATSVTT